MKQQFTYLRSLLIIFIIPDLGALVYLWLMNRISLPLVLLFCCIVSLIAISWDLWATKHGFHDPFWLWKFNRKSSISRTIHDLPIEEYAFYIGASLWVVCLWELIQTRNSQPLWIAATLMAVWSGGAVLYLLATKAPKDKVA